MHVICKDGTTIQCRDFEATDSGVLFFQETPGRREESEDEEEEDERESASGFVPITELRFVLPDEMVQPGTGAQRGARETGQQAPPGARQQGVGMAQQQQMGGQQGGQTRRGPGPGGQ